MKKVSVLFKKIPKALIWLVHWWNSRYRCLNIVFFKLRKRYGHHRRTFQNKSLKTVYNRIGHTTIEYFENPASFNTRNVENLRLPLLEKTRQCFDYSPCSGISFNNVPEKCKILLVEYRHLKDAAKNTYLAILKRFFNKFLFYISNSFLKISL